MASLLRGLTLTSLALLTGSASAQVVTTGPFVGQQSDSFETQLSGQFTTCITGRVFNNTADLCDLSGASQNMHITSGWGFYCTIYPYSGNFFTASAGGPAEYLFDQPASRFGGYFATNSGTPDATAEFFDVGGNLLATLNVTAPTGTSGTCNFWTWNGWQVTGGPGIKRIKITGLNGFNGGGFIDMDDVEVDYSPTGGTPSYYCTAGTTSHGCLAAINASAQPSASHAGGCLISVGNVEGQKNGLIFFGLDNSGFTPISWGLGGTSFLCVKAPTVRTPPQSSNGTAAQCDGAFALDLDLYTTGNPINPGTGLAWVAGDEMFLQAWFRDPTAVKTTNLSDAVELHFVP